VGYGFVFQIFSETFLILRRIQRHITEIFSKILQIPSFMKIRPEGAKLFHADGQTDERTATTKLTPLFAILLPRLRIVLLYRLEYYRILLKNTWRLLS